MQQLHFEHLEHKPQASWDSSEGICTGEGDHSLLLDLTYLLSSLLMTTYLKRSWLSLFWTLRSREWTFTSQLHLIITPF